jgi:hypothetical protein
MAARHGLPTCDLNDIVPDKITQVKFPHTLALSPPFYVPLSMSLLMCVFLLKRDALVQSDYFCAVWRQSDVLPYLQLSLM